MTIYNNPIVFIFTIIVAVIVRLFYHTKKRNRPRVTSEITNEELHLY